jgi:hypothetical protein
MSEDAPQQSNPDEEAESAPMNRAERRAKGKKGAQQAQHANKQHFTPKNAQGQGPRIWSNRKAG